MRPALAFLPLLFVFLFAATAESRKDPEKYWKMVMKDEEMPQGIQGLLQLTSENKPKMTPEQLVEGSKLKCEEPLVTNTQITIEEKGFTENVDTKLGYKNEEPQANSEFEPRPSVTNYDDFEPRPSTTKYNDFKPRPSTTKYNDFEPRSSVSKYNDFEPRPSTTKYNDFEPRSSVSKYNDFEPRPSTTKYNDFEPRSSTTKYNDFEPRPSTTKYNDFEPRPSTTQYND
ncbi:organ-specific protein P4-like [Abrus precatorius]|uniref:Organ-specific protein P4-like n=1 Tax=Abrus precatorius TaxID=3816 RepID=A0A8B8LJ57_ABRPR|nr:organ-specific protein P4-like [Abrus precatorius]